MQILIGNVTLELGNHLWTLTVGYKVTRIRSPTQCIQKGTITWVRVLDPSAKEIRVHPNVEVFRLIQHNGS